jgi:hypothetical protein
MNHSSNGTAGSFDTDEGARAYAENVLRPEGPLPLHRDVPPPEPFPVEALGNILEPAARAIHDKIQAPLAMCAQSVLAAAALAVQGHANVRLPYGQSRPISEFFLTIAFSGERKSAVDAEALAPIRQREAELRDLHRAEMPSYLNDKAAWDSVRTGITKSKKDNRSAMKAALDLLGPEPPPPLVPLLTCAEPTLEGLTKLLAIGQPSLGIFASEGAQFIGGHGMTAEAKLRSAGGISVLWDGGLVQRVRSGDGTTILGNKRVSMHLMAQPDVASQFLTDPVLQDQGLLSRFLIVSPSETSGTRFVRDVQPATEANLKSYQAQLLKILQTPAPPEPFSKNSLEPRELPLTYAATTLWNKFSDHIEARNGSTGEFVPIRGFANKLAEHAGRLAAVLTLVRDISAEEIDGNDMASGIKLAQHYAGEALRLWGASRVSDNIRIAKTVLDWAQQHSPDGIFSLVDTYQRGPFSVREKDIAKAAITTLEGHGWLQRIPGGAEIRGQHRREVYRIVGH